jgi:hypothetical protein
LSESPYWRERREGAIAPQLPWTLVTDAAEPAPATDRKVLV